MSYTSYTSHHGLFRFVQMFFRLRNDPSPFQRTIDVTLSAVKWPCALVFLDNIVFFAYSAASHTDHVKHVLTRLRDAGGTLNVKINKLFLEPLNYSSHIICPGRWKTASHPTDAYKGLRSTRNFTELKFFFGLCNDFRQCLPNFGRNTSPLEDELQNYEPFNFELEESTRSDEDLSREFDFATGSCVTVRRRAIDARHRCLLGLIQMCTTAGTTWYNYEANRVLVSLANKRRTRIQYDAARMSRYCIGGAAS